MTQLLPRISELPPLQSLQRGACPSLATPMPTGDGLLVRFRPVAPGLTPAQWVTLAKLAATFGNGLIEVTARGNLQIRGLGESTVPLLAEALDAAGLPSQSGVAIETPPLAGLDATEIADARPLAERIRRAIDEHRPALKLAPKLAIIVNGGGKIDLSTMSADLRLDAVRSGERTLWRLAIAGDADSARLVAMLPEAETAGKVMALLRILAERSPLSRGRDLDEGMVPTVQDIPALLPVQSPAPVGKISIPGMSVLALRLTFGRMKANQLTSLMRDLDGLGANEIRPSPHHALLVLGLGPEAIDAARALAKEHGFLTRGDDPANSISACPGLLCTSAHIDTRAVAETLIAAAPVMLDGSPFLHVSGCAKGCAHPAAAPVTVVGSEAGIRLVAHGRAGDAHIAPPDLKTVFSRLEMLCQHHRQPGETTKSLLQRLGPTALNAILKGDA